MRRTGAEAALSARLDPLGLLRSLAETSFALARQPEQLISAALSCSQLVTRANLAALAAGLGASTTDPVAADPRDHRFDDPAWRDNVAFRLLAQWYLIGERMSRQLVDVADIEPETRRKASFAASMIFDALAPTNSLLTNPAAIERAFQTGGLSLLRGARNVVRDVASNGGRPQQVDTSGFEVGRNLAATLGKVVYRNELMELIQYEPRTETVFDIPVLASPPWINKYYIMDLAPGRSLIEWAIDNGHTTFAISYRNPVGAMRDLTMDDYLHRGPLTALDVMSEITGSDQAHVVGLCIGGTLTVMLAAWLAHEQGDRLRTLTLLNTLVDFSDPGDLGVFTDRAAVERLVRKMDQQGYLEAESMSRTFDMLRPNDMIWKYVAANWLMGDTPPAFDILAWNADGTRMPAAMHTAYLRSCYLDNALAKNEFKLAGRPLRLDEVVTETYILAAKNDHITPWHGSYRTTQLLKGEIRFVLSSSGHIAGVVCPPDTRARHWTNSSLPPNADDWLAGATLHDGSWWKDWVGWIGDRSGERRAPPPTGTKKHPPLADAPGAYVHERGTTPD